MTPDIEVGLSQLEALLEQMLTLLEWEKITQPAHQMALPPSFRFQDHVQADLREVYGLFLQLVGTLKQILVSAEPRIAPQRRERLRKRLGQLEQKAAQLDLGARFIKA